MSTAGKRRAAGPAVTTGGTTGGARKATATEPAAKPHVTAASLTSHTAPPASRPVTDSTSRTVRSTTWVRADQRLALRDAVEASGETFDPAEWTFDDSNLLVTLAHRRVARGSGRDRLVISNECYSAWVTVGQDPVEMAGDLFRTAPLARNQITWLLDDEVRYGVGEWTLRPVGMRGWVASRRTRTRRTRHFVVAANGSYVPVASPDAATVTTALATLETQQPSRQPVRA